MTQPHERKQSPAKSAVAMQKPRNAQGQFLSGEELQAYRAQQQQAQYAAEQEKLRSLFGGSGPAPQQPQGMQQQPMENPEREKWDYLLGKKRSNLRW